MLQWFRAKVHPFVHIVFEQAHTLHVRGFFSELGSPYILCALAAQGFELKEAFMVSAMYGQHFISMPFSLLLRSSVWIILASPGNC